MENTGLKGAVTTDNTTVNENPDVNLNFDKNYTGLFPTVNLTYELAENENITLGYNKKSIDHGIGLSTHFHLDPVKRISFKGIQI